MNQVHHADVVIIARLKPPKRDVLDYFVIPAVARLRGSFQTSEVENDPFLEIYRFDNLEAFTGSFRQFSIADVS